MYVCMQGCMYVCLYIHVNTRADMDIWGEERERAREIIKNKSHRGTEKDGRTNHIFVGSSPARAQCPSYMRELCDLGQPLA